MRPALLNRLRAGGLWDLVVIGGGATGLGAAVEAAARGYRTLVLEAHDFAQGTSSRSTKLIHGGVRYLASGQIHFVREALRERAVLLRNAPHLVHPLRFLVPAYSWTGIPYFGLGLAMYDLLAGQRGFGPSRPIKRNEALQLAPTLAPRHLRGGVVYFDGQFDDARLALALAQTVTDLGGTALNYLPLTGFLKERGRMAGVTARDAETGEEFTIMARAVINATGVYADSVRALDDPRAAPMLRPSRGVHLVLDRRFLPGDTAVLVPRTDDGRVLFAIPWLERVLLGTTDTPTEGTPIEPRPSADEVAYLLAHAARYLDPAPRAEDVLTAFAGLRPLIDAGGTGATARLSREHVAVVSDSGLVTITGGKWTTYRVMAADAVVRAVVVGALPRGRPGSTEDLRLHGWVPDPAGGRADPLSAYGSDAPALRQVIAERPEWGERLHPDLPYLAGEVVWAARHEWARTVEDVLARRTRALLLDARAAPAAAPRVAEILAEALGRDGAWLAGQVRRFCGLAAGYRINHPVVP